MPWQIAIQIAKRYFPQVMLPITITIGFIGYSIETYWRPLKPLEGRPKSVSELREERRLREMETKSWESQFSAQAACNIAVYRRFALAYHK